MEHARQFEHNWTVHYKYGVPDGSLHYMEITVDHCLVGEQATDMAERCELLYSKYILIMVCRITFLESVLMLGVLVLHHKHTLVHIGDAITDELENGTSLSRQDSNYPTLIPTGSWGHITVLRSKWSSLSGPRWHQAVTKTFWIVSMTLFGLGIAVGFSLFGVGIVSYHEDRLPASLPALVKDGIGKVYGATLIGAGPLISRTEALGIGHVRHVLFANMFQVLISFEYLFYNNILTCQVVGDEFIRFLTERKALRVSSPKIATQRSSYFLSLPWKYAVPQMIAFIALHWLVSQSVFTVQTTCYGPGARGQRIPSRDASRVGYSVLAIVLATLLGVLLVLLLGLNSLRRYPKAPDDFPRMAVNSAAISANCRRPLDDRDAHLYPVRLGAVRHGVHLLPDCQGRITFSSDAEIVQPVSDAPYEIAKWVEYDRSILSTIAEQDTPGHMPRPPSIFTRVGRVWLDSEAMEWHQTPFARVRGFGNGIQASFAGFPEIVVPVRQVQSYNPFTREDEWQAVTVVFTAPGGCDAVRGCLDSLGLLREVRPGKTAYDVGEEKE